MNTKTTIDLQTSVEDGNNKDNRLYNKCIKNRTQNKRNLEMIDNETKLIDKTLTWSQFKT